MLRRHSSRLAFPPRHPPPPPPPPPLPPHPPLPHPPLPPFPPPPFPPPPPPSVVTATACACPVPKAHPRCCAMAKPLSIAWARWEGILPLTCPWYVPCSFTPPFTPSFPPPPPSSALPSPPNPAIISDLNPKTLLFPPTLVYRTTAWVARLPTWLVDCRGWGRRRPS